MKQSYLDLLQEAHSQSEIVGELKQKIDEANEKAALIKAQAEAMKEEFEIEYSIFIENIMSGKLTDFQALSFADCSAVYNGLEISDDVSISAIRNAVSEAA